MTMDALWKLPSLMQENNTDFNYADMLICMHCARVVAGLVAWLIKVRRAPPFCVEASIIEV